MSEEAVGRRCTAPGHGAFDFWIGSWDVVDADGSAAGTNRIVPILDGCGLFESWQGESGHLGHSLNVHVGATDRWHQSWVDGGGSVLLLDGGLDPDGRMVLVGRPTTAPADHEHRIAWSAEAGGEVRQLWERRIGDGPWEVLFDGRYRRAEERDPA